MLQRLSESNHKTFSRELHPRTPYPQLILQFLLLKKRCAHTRPWICHCKHFSQVGLSNNTYKKSSLQPESKFKVIWQNFGGGGTGSWALTLIGLWNCRNNKLKLTYFFIFMFGLFSLTGLLEIQYRFIITNTKNIRLYQSI